MTGPHPSQETSFETLLCEVEPDTEVVSDSLSTGVLEQVADGDFDGVVCRADGSEAITLVARIRGRNTNVPIAVLSAGIDSGFKRQAINRGASIVVSAEVD